MRLTDNDEHASHYFMADNVDLNSGFFMPYAMDIIKLAIVFLCISLWFSIYLFVNYFFSDFFLQIPVWKPLL